MTPVHLVMPMAGRGSRFHEAGFDLPKPLLRLFGQPFFWWAAESVRRCFDVRSMTFVVLREHVERHRIDEAILGRYPGSAVVVLPETTAGALVTARFGCEAVSGGGWVLVNDCDHAFRAESLAAGFDGLTEGASGLLCHFRSRDPAYSYARYCGDGRLRETVEKRVVSDLAIAGAYGFRDKSVFLDHAAEYEAACPYAEPFMSGVYNTIVAHGGVVRGGVLDRHVSFGTPSEYARARDAIVPFQAWPLAAACA